MSQPIGLSGTRIARSAPTLASEPAITTNRGTKTTSELDDESAPGVASTNARVASSRPIVSDQRAVASQRERGTGRDTIPAPDIAVTVRALPE